MLGIFLHAFLSANWKVTFSKIYFKNTIRVVKSLDLSVLIWVQSVCKFHQQSTKVAASRPRVKCDSAIIYFYQFIPPCFCMILFYNYLILTCPCVKMIFT